MGLALSKHGLIETLGQKFVHVLAHPSANRHLLSSPIQAYTISFGIATRPNQVPQ